MDQYIISGMRNDETHMGTSFYNILSVIGTIVFFELCYKPRPQNYSISYKLQAIIYELYKGEIGKFTILVANKFIEVSWYQSKYTLFNKNIYNRQIF